jgi:hypothetical protein
MSHLRVVEAPVKGSARYMRVIAPLDLGRESAMPLASKIKTKQEAAIFPAPLLCSGASKQAARGSRQEGSAQRASARSCVGSNRRSAQAKKFAFQGLAIRLPPLDVTVTPFGNAPRVLRDGQGALRIGRNLFASAKEGEFIASAECVRQFLHFLKLRRRFNA